MSLGWKGLLWGTCAAVIVGALTAAAVARSWPEGLTRALALVIAVATVLSLAGPAARRWRHWRRGASSYHASARFEHGRVPLAVAARGDGATPDDWETLADLCGALGRVQVAWLRTNTFVTPWHDGNARTTLDLRPRASALRERPFPAELYDALGRFCDALAAFAEFYERESFPDPLLLGTEWRFFDWDHPHAFVHTARDGDLWDGRSDRMHSLSVSVANTFEALLATASADPRFRTLIETGVAAQRST